MAYNWFKIFNKTVFLATGLVSKNYTLNLENVGQKEILVTNGNAVGITYEGVFLALVDGFNNPFEFEGFAIYINETLDVFLGLPIED